MEAKEEMRKYVRTFLWFTLIINIPLIFFFSSVGNLVLAILVLFCLIMFREPNKTGEEKNE